MIVEALRAYRNRPWEFNLQGTMYTFLPDEDGKMVCDITNDYHLQLLEDRPQSFTLRAKGPEPEPVVAENAGGTVEETQANTVTTAPATPPAFRRSYRK